MTTVTDLLAYDPNKVKPGWIAFFIVLALVIATFLLWRSMNTQLGKIQAPPRASFGPDGELRKPAPKRDDRGPKPTASPPEPPSDQPGES